MAVVQHCRNRPCDRGCLAAVVLHRSAGRGADLLHLCTQPQLAHRLCRASLTRSCGIFRGRCLRRRHRRRSGDAQFLGLRRVRARRQPGTGRRFRAARLARERRLFSDDHARARADRLGCRVLLARPHWWRRWIARRAASRPRSSRHGFCPGLPPIIFSLSPVSSPSLC